MRRLAVIAFLAAACGSASLAQPHTLSLAYKAGETHKYSFHSTSKQAISTSGMTFPADIDMKADEVLNVKSVDSSGTANLTVTLSNFTLKSTTNGMTNTTTGLPVTSLDMQIGSDGRLISLDGNQFAGSSPFAAFSGIGGGFFVTAVLPENPVKPGDTWTKTYDQTTPGGTGGIHVTSKSTYLRDETLKGVSAAVVETKSTATVAINLDSSHMAAGQPASSGTHDLSLKGTTTSDVTTWIDPNGHRVLKTHSTVTNDGTMDFHSTQTIPGLTGPLAIKGDSTTDLTAA